MDASGANDAFTATAGDKGCCSILTLQLQGGKGQCVISTATAGGREWCLISAATAGKQGRCSVLTLQLQGGKGDIQF